jgi:hypothetical protein
MIGEEMISHKCQECAFSLSLDWAESQCGLVFCVHPQMGHFGNWSQRIVNAEDNACAHFQEQAELPITQ